MIEKDGLKIYIEEPSVAVTSSFKLIIEFSSSAINDKIYEVLHRASELDKAIYAVTQKLYEFDHKLSNKYGYDWIHNIDQEGRICYRPLRILPLKCVEDDDTYTAFKILGAEKQRLLNELNKVYAELVPLALDVLKQKLCDNKPEIEVGDS